MLKSSNNKFKVLSASAVALIALTGTAYGTNLAEEAKVNEPSAEEERVEVNAQSEEFELELEGQESDIEKSEDEQEVEESEDKSEDETEVEESEDESEDEQEVDSEEEQEEEQEDEQEVDEQEVDEELVVPFSELPLDEETGLLHFPEYHEIAKGRALPRPLTDEEQEYFALYVEEGQYNEIRTSVTQTDYEFIYVYPKEHYSPELHTLKWHKYVEIKSELLTLDKQQEFLDEQQEVYNMSIELGEIYDEELGYFVQQGNQDDDYVIDKDFDDLDKDDDLYEDTDPSENEDAVQEIHFEEKAILDNLIEYDSMTPDEFIEAYGVNFLFRGVVEEGGFAQQEYAIGKGLTLVVEAESLKVGGEDSEDMIILQWGIVREVVRYNETIENLYQEGQYNLTTNSSSAGYVEDNVLSIGYGTLREDGAYTPQKLLVEYVDDNQVPHAYHLVADTIHSGDDRPLHSDIVGYIEYGWEIGTSGEGDGTVGGGSGEGEGDNNNGSGEGDDTVGGGSGEGEGGSNNGSGTGSDSGGTDNNDGQGSESGSGTGNNDEQGSGSSSDTTDKDDSKDTVNGEEDSERFQQTGTSIIWGSILSGLGLGALGAYFYKKSNKDKEG